MERENIAKIDKAYKTKEVKEAYENIWNGTQDFPFAVENFKKALDEQMVKQGVSDGTKRVEISMVGKKYIEIKGSEWE